MGEPSYTTIMLPYSYALLMSAHTYWTSVFFGHVTRFTSTAVATASPRYQVQALEALHRLPSRGRSSGQPTALTTPSLYDAGKYGRSVLGEYWDIEENLLWPTRRDARSGHRSNRPLPSDRQIPTGYTRQQNLQHQPVRLLDKPPRDGEGLQVGSSCLSS